MLTRRVYSSLAALVVSAGIVGAQSARDPLDGSTLSLPDPTPWNRAGGEDPDGCVHSIDPEGRWTVAGLDDVVVFPRTKLALKREHLGRPLSTAHAAELRTLLRQAPSTEFPLADRYATAAEVYGVLCWLSEADVGDLYLRAAWAVRGAVSIPGAAGFRPQSVAEGLEGLAQLERQLGLEQTRLHGVDRILDVLDNARGHLRSLDPPTVGGRLAREQIRRSLFAVEQEALRLKAELPAEARGPAPAERYVLLAWAAQRMGEPQARDRWLRRVSSEFSERLGPRITALKAAFAAESVLLAKAGDRYARALDAPLPASEEARVACLLGETQKRLGNDPTAAFQRAVRVAHRSLAGQRAKQRLSEAR